jgi:hypothetical protein
MPPVLHGALDVGQRIRATASQCSAAEVGEKEEFGQYNITYMQHG